MQEKSFKEYCADAKKRLKSGFWKDYKKNLDKKIEDANKKGIATSKVKEYYTSSFFDTYVSKKEEDEAFYKKVCEILDNEGEVSGIITRLMDKEIYDKLSYEEQQRYNLEISSKYLSALDRYKREKIFN